MDREIEGAMTAIELETTAFDELEPALHRLDFLLARAVAAAREGYGIDLGSDAYRGLYIDEVEVDRLLRRQPGKPTLTLGDGPVPPWEPPDQTRFGWLRSAFGLSTFDLDIVLLTLAPEIDLRYERLYAYLQDDVTRKAPSVDLALNILCESASEKLARRAHFLAGAPLVDESILHLDPDTSTGTPHELATPIRLDEQIIHMLLGHDCTDRRLNSWTRLCSTGEPMTNLTMPTHRLQSLVSLAEQSWNDNVPWRVMFRGLRDRDRLGLASTLATAVEAPLLIANLARADWSRSDDLPRVLFREAWLRGALLLIERLEAILVPERLAILESFSEALREDSGITIFSMDSGGLPAELRTAGVMPIDLPPATAEIRRLSWQGSLAEFGIDVDPDTLDALTERFKLTPSQIDEAALEAQVRSFALGEEGQTTRSLFEAARAQTRGELATLTQKLDPVFGWEDIVLPVDTIRQLHELCAWAIQRDQVLESWGFGSKLSRGKGAAALFAGASGTGKTMAAEVIASELQLDLYRIDLSSVVSKYIGETEKNLDRIFTAAEDANAILFFDEADALFGKRSEVRDSHDRYANIEISYLLQKMEEYEGITILATNLRQNLDEAFVRRLAFTIHFPFPSEADRKRISRGIWPADAPLADDIDLDALASAFQLSGGNIKNIALAAAYLAAASDQPIGMTHLAQAIRREYQKLGKAVSDEELARDLNIPVSAIAQSGSSHE